MLNCTEKVRKGQGPVSGCWCLLSSYPFSPDTAGAPGDSVVQGGSPVLLCLKGDCSKLQCFPAL